MVLHFEMGAILVVLAGGGFFFARLLISYHDYTARLVGRRFAPFALSFFLLWLSS